jgi:hypothetical protein
MTGKIILGLASTVATVGGALAFRAHKGGGGNVMVGKTVVAGHCYKCYSLWSLANSGHNTVCHTMPSGGGRTLHGIRGFGSHTWYTQTISGGCPTGPSHVVRTRTTTTI